MIPDHTKRPATTVAVAATVHPDAIERHGAPTDLPCVDSDTLLRGHSSVAIAHNGTVYRLQATRQGKLILTK